MNTYDYNLNIFYNEDDISYYLLGVIMSDGCVIIDKSKKKVSITSKDKDWLETIGNLICKDKPIYKHGKAWVLYFHSTKLADWLISKGCTPAKSLTLKFPNVPEQYLADFMRGCIDGDGSLGIYQTFRKRSNKFEKQIKCYLCSSSYDFLKQFSIILNNKNINHSFYKIKQPNTGVIEGRVIYRSSEHYRVLLGLNATKSFVKWIYYPEHKISLERKKIIANDIIKNH